MPVRGATLQPFLAAGPAGGSRSGPRWSTAADARLRDRLVPLLHPVVDTVARLPFEVADYVDFYASLDHATNVGRIMAPSPSRCCRTGGTCRSATTAAPGPSSSPGPTCVRPCGQRKAPADDGPSYFGPSRRLDIEAELGFVVGVPSTLGSRGSRRRPSRTTCSASSGSTTGRRGTSRAGSTSRSAPSSASRSRHRCRPGSPRWPRCRRGPMRAAGSGPDALGAPPGPGAGGVRHLAWRSSSTARSWARPPYSLDVPGAGPDARAPDVERRLAPHR